MTVKFNLWPTIPIVSHKDFWKSYICPVTSLTLSSFLTSRNGARVHTEIMLPYKHARSNRWRLLHVHHGCSDLEDKNENFGHREAKESAQPSKHTKRQIFFWWCVWSGFSPILFANVAHAHAMILSQEAWHWIAWRSSPFPAVIYDANTLPLLDDSK